MAFILMVNGLIVKNSSGQIILYSNQQKASEDAKAFSMQYANTAYVVYELKSEGEYINGNKR